MMIGLISVTLLMMIGMTMVLVFMIMLNMIMNSGDYDA